MSPRRVVRPSILREVPLDQHAVLEASAGTGKTFALEHLVVELLLATDVTLDRVLVVTFTEKATNELRARVRAKLDELLAGGGDEPNDEQVRAGDFWTIDASARDKLARARQTFDGATIATIHAYCQRVLRENAFDGGRLFEEEQVDGRESLGRALRDALRQDVACDPIRAPWLEAGLRSGFSLDRIEDLLWKCLQAHADLRPVFDAAALLRMLEAFPAEEARQGGAAVVLKGLGAHPRTATTVARKLFAIAEAVERALASGDAPQFVIDAQDLDFDYLFEKVSEYAARPSGAARLLTAALELGRATPSFQAAMAQTMLGPVLRQLATRKREAGQYDFDDMLVLVDEALHGPRGAALAEAMRRRWRYTLIDEFQDTDETQWSIFRRAFFVPDGGPSGMYLVGDPKQSIYRFRGADVHTYLRARDEVVAAGGARVHLDRSFRATPALVGATNRFFDQQAERPVFTGSVSYDPIECGRPDRALVDGDGNSVAPVHSFRFAGAIVPSTLGVLIAREIRAMVDPARPWRLDGRALELADVFVLTRTRAEGRAMGAALRAAGVPRTFYKEDGLFQTDEAKEIRTLLAAIDDPEDRGRRLAAWLTPFFGLSLDVVERARDLPASHPYVARLIHWKALADARDFGEFFEAIVRDSGVLRREIFFSDGDRELTNYLHVLELLLEHARRTRATLRDLLEELSGLIDRTRLPLDLEGNVQRLESEGRAVQIMTIHKAKGLEAPVVFLAGGWSRVPAEDVRVYHDAGRRLAWVGSSGVDPRAKEEEREEEQRLMYVALTRAKGRLYLPCAVADGDAARMQGPYDVVNRRLADLARTDAPWLCFEEVRMDGAQASSGARAAADGWSPPAALLRDEDRSAAYARLRAQRVGVVLTSYTRLRASRGAFRGAETQGWGDDRGRATADPSPTTLRGARTSGVFLHELLERVPIASFAERAAGIEPWRARSDVAALFDEAVDVHRIDRAQRDHAERMIWAAYTTRIELPSGDTLDGLVAAGRLVREMDFVYPLGQGRDATAPDGRTKGGDRYVRGSLDLLFEQGEKTYFVDWKSDSLASYDRGALGQRVLSHYDDQRKLYALAVIKLLGLQARKDYDARFGGILYCFLRGLDESGGGVWSVRPTWDETRQWEGLFDQRHDAGDGDE